MATEVEETLKRLGSHNSVKGTIVVNFDGIPIKSTMDPHTTTQYSGTVFRFCNSFIKPTFCKNQSDLRNIVRTKNMYLKSVSAISIIEKKPSSLEMCKKSSKYWDDNFVCYTYLKWIPGTGLFKQLIDQAKAMFKDIDNTNDLTFLRLRTKKHEIMVAPEKDYLLIVVQETTDI